MTHWDNWQEQFPGINISLKVPGRDKAGSDWVGMYRSAGGGGIAEMSPRTSNVHLADRSFDMDAATGYRRGPGSAGAHPVCRGEGVHSAAFLREGKGGDLSRTSSCQTPRYTPETAFAESPK